MPFRSMFNAAALAATALATIASIAPAGAQIVRSSTTVVTRGAPPPHGHPAPPPPPSHGHRAPHGGVVVVNRGQAGWWRGYPGFAAYAGPRVGFYYAPGYGYYAIPRGYTQTSWAVGTTLPSTMHRFVVVQPASYGLAVASPGYRWYYAGTNFVLVRASNGVIVRSVAGGW